jgi:YD repeat-containing protein
VDSDHEFRHTVNLSAGSQSVAVVAKDYGAGSGNTTTKNASVNPQGGTARTLSYDNNGNLTQQDINGTITYYTWDAEDRLLSVRTGSQMSKFYYDGFSRRTKIEEGTYSGGVFTPSTSLTKKFIWVGGTIAEERNNSDVVQKKFYGLGEWRTGVGNLYRSLTENCAGSCGGGFRLGPRRRGRSIPAAGCDDLANAGHGQTTRRPKGFRGKGRLALLLLGQRPLRASSLVAPRQPAFSTKTGPRGIFSQALTRGTTWGTCAS